jgi:hypothetical protein
MWRCLRYGCGCGTCHIQDVPVNASRDTRHRVAISWVALLLPLVRRSAAPRARLPGPGTSTLTVMEMTTRITARVHTVDRPRGRTGHVNDAVVQPVIGLAYVLA